MARPLGKSLRVLLLAAMLLLLLLLLFGIALHLNWPLWVGFSLVLLAIGTALGAGFCRQLWLRRAGASLAENAVGQEPTASGAPPNRAGNVKELRSRWKRAIATLRRSHLRKQGNPLYALPWYLLIGDGGNGKTTTLTGADLCFPLTEMSRAAGAAATESCDWWFFDQGIVIDTAGRYAFPVDEQRDREEWRALLRLLTRYRRREPLNGLIVTVAADRLQNATDGHALAADGHTIRCRIDELMKVLGVRFPVYLLVTRCDLIQGMTEFMSRLPDRTLTQAMGVLNRTVTADAVGFTEKACATLGERLRKLRLLLPPTDRSRPRLLLFPEEFAALQERLVSFMGAAFGDNQYQETPTLRGLYFCSGRHPYSPPAASPGVSCEKPRSVGDRGLFLHDFFTKILHQGRWMFAPTRRELHWRQVTGNLGVVSWLVLGFALCGLLSFSFVKNLATIRQMPGEASRPPEMHGELSADLIAIDRYRRQVLAVEERNRQWWLPRFGLTASLTLERELKIRFCRRFRDGFLAPFDRRMTDDLSALPPSVPDETYGRDLIHLIRRINLLKARQAGQGYEALKGMPQPDFPRIAAHAEPDANYLCYLSWRRDGGELEREVSEVRISLKRLLALKGGDMRWLVAWADRQSGMQPVTLAQFWGGSLQAPPETMVSPAFTRQGKAALASLFREMETALPDGPVTVKQRASFEQWYRQASLAAWEAFAVAFPGGRKRLQGEREWREAAARMSTDQGPYFAFFDRLAGELEEEIVAKNPPPWLRQLRLWQLIVRAGGTGENPALDKAAESGKKLLASLQSKTGNNGDLSGLALFEGARAYREYRSALNAVAAATVSRPQAYQAAAQLYGEDPAVGKSPVLLAFATSGKLGATLGAGKGSNATTLRLIGGPLEFLWFFLRAQAAGQLQSQWEEQVLAGASSMEGEQTTLLLGPDGVVWKFVKGPAAPFLTRSPRGYRPKVLFGAGVPFAGAFFTFLERGSQVQAAVLSRQSSYGVGIQGLPTDANHEAHTKPHATRLELQCGASSQTLANLNYPVGRTFTWSPDSCGDVTFQIEVGDQVLTKRYGGPRAFAEFLRSFPGGQRIFHPREFPGERPALERMGITYLKVNYQFTGSGPVIRQASSVGGLIPRTIVKSRDFGE